MKRLIVWLMIFLCCGVAWAATTTTNYGLYKPAVGDTDWGDLINGNFDTIDTQMKTTADAEALNTSHRTDNTQAHSDYLLNNQSDSTTGTITAGGFIGDLTGNADTSTLSQAVNWTAVEALSPINSAAVNWDSIEVAAPITEAMIGDLGSYLTQVNSANVNWDDIEVYGPINTNAVNWDDIIVNTPITTEMLYSKTGADTTVVTGTAGTTDQCAKWNIDGDLVTSGGPCGSTSGTDTHVLFFDGDNTPAGDAGMTYNKTNNALTLLGSLTASEVIVGGTGQSTIDEGLVVNDSGGAGAEDNFRVETDNQASALSVNASADTISLDVPLFIKEQADASADATNYGQFWVDSDNSLPYFTDDGGTDYALTGASLGAAEVQSSNINWTDIEVLSPINVDAVNWLTTTDLTSGGAVLWGNLAEGELPDSSVVSADINWTNIENILDTNINWVAFPSFTDDYYLRANGTGVAFEAVTGSGDVSKVGTPVDNQVGVWTGDGTLEGDANLLWSGTKMSVIGTDGSESALYVKESSGSDTFFNGLTIDNSANGSAIRSTITFKNRGTAIFYIGQEYSNFIGVDSNAGKTVFSLGAGEAAFNPLTADIDFAVDTDAQADAFKIDAGAETIKTLVATILAQKTSDPCGATYPEGSLFYNSTSHYYCYCNGTNDVKLHDPSTACF